MLELISSLNLFVIGLMVSASAILGIVVLLNNTKSITHRTFFLFALVTVCYSLINYAQIKVQNPELSLWLLRFTIFFAVWHAFSFFQLFYVFPEETVPFGKWYRYGFVPLVAGVSLMNLTSLVFSRVAETSSLGNVTKVVNGPGIYIFALLIFFLVFGGIALLIWKMRRAEGNQRHQFHALAWGTAVTFGLILVFNFLLPAFLDESQFVVFAPLFFFAFIASSTYAIMRYRLFDTHVIATELFTFSFMVIALAETVFPSSSLFSVLIRVLIFPLSVAFGILLIKSVRGEVRQREQVAQLSRFKTELISVVSHQIKSPIAAIKGFTANLSDGLYGPLDEKVREVLKKITRSSDALVMLINTFLDARKIDEGKIEYQFVPTDIAELLRDTIELMRPLAEEKKLSLECEVPSSPFMIRADAPKFRQVIQNLVDNSIKYTEQGFVKITLSHEGNEAMLKITDSGGGIAPELIPRLFEQFTRDERVKKKILGTGLGLYIAKKIVEAHGGTISVESPGEGKGATFIVRVAAMI